MRRLATVICLLLSMSGPALSADLENLYLTGQWFHLRDAVAADPKAPDFYRGAVAAAFNDQAGAERYLNAVMKSGSDPSQRVDAGLLLEELYTHAGRRKAAASQLQRVEKLLHDLAVAKTVDRAVYRDFQKVRNELAALDGYPDQTVAARGFSRIPYFQIGNQIVAPVTINGKPANYYLDTGAVESVMSEAEAKRLGLEVHPTSISIQPYGGHGDVQATGIAVVHDLVIGNVHLRSVAFVVLKDEGYDGLLGLPVLRALETLRWTSDGTLEIGFPAAPRNVTDANLCLEGGSLIAEAAFGNEKLNFTVDTGTYETLLFPTFTRQFAAMVAASGTPEPFDINETNHDPEARTLSTLTLRVGGADVTAGRIHALAKNFTEDGPSEHGNMGMDFAGNAQSVGLDFAAMRLTVDGGVATAGSAAACPLPPNFACLGGFVCTVRYDPEVRCHIDRVPAEAPAGNDLPAPDYPDGASNCALPSSFVCPRGVTCTAFFDGKDGCRIDKVPTAAPTAPTPEPTRTTAAPVSKLPPAAGPDAREIVERSLKFESLSLSPAKDYVYTDESVEKYLDADGKVKSTTVETKEVMTIYDQQYERLISKDGKPLPPDKARAEQARFDKAVDRRSHESLEAKAKREEAERKQSAKELVCGGEFLKLFAFELKGAGDVNGRPAWIVEFTPLPHTSPTCEETKLLAKLHFRIWIDQTEYRWAQLEADNIAPITWGKVLVRVPTAALHVTFQQMRLQEGVWMASKEYARVDPRLMVFAKLHIEISDTYGNYRKFQSNSKIVPLGEPK